MPRACRSVVSATAMMFTAAAAAAQTTYPLPRVMPVPAPPAPLVVQPLSSADLLADQIRALNVNPLDLAALVRAGELALKLGDTTAAAAFFARAERIDPRNARVKAGEGSLLVIAERPGEALRRFAEAETFGGDARGFLADRALAYDLIGEQERAQRGYRLALRGAADDETQRRYALSLGISGKREQALAQIEPLLRRSDRGAWRARAFILAMTGDQAGAEKIATSMMPGGMAQGLQPFFVILPTLSPVDRAFAVHFGEVRTTPERVADARLTPPLAALGPDPTAPVVVAAVVARPVAVSRQERKRRYRRVEIAVQTEPPPVRLPQLLASRAVVRVTPQRTASVVPGPPPTIQASASTVAPVTPARAAAAVEPTRSVTIPARDALVASAAPAPKPIAVPPTRVPLISTVTSPPLPPAEPILVIASAPSPVPAMPVPTAAASATIAPGPAKATPVRSEDSILASILNDIKVPPSELDDTPLAPAPRPVPIAPDPAPDAALVARAEAERRLADQKRADQKQADQKQAEQKAAKALAERQAAERDIAVKKAADKKAAADKKLADKRAADIKAKADAKKAEEARKHDPKVLEPARFWVQVAGGATGHDLGKAWSAARGKSAALRGKAGYTTPLRATNRVLTGPFRTEGEAQAFVNTLAKEGLSGFVFSSLAGQKIDKLSSE